MAAAEVKRIPATTKADSFIDSGTAGTTLTAAQSGLFVVLTNAAGFVTLPSVSAANIGVQFVVLNATASDNATAVRGDGSDLFYDNDTDSGETASQQVDKMKAKTVVCFAADSWAVIG